jgi:UDP-N-acetylglucosamine 4,6-dehydratase
MAGGEIFVPKIPSMNIIDLAKAIAPDCLTEEVGIRPGEKLHETLITEDDARCAVEHDGYYVIQPDPQTALFRRQESAAGGRPCPEGFSYASDTNPRRLSLEELRRIVGIADAREVA